MNPHDIRFTGRWKTRLPPDAMYAKLADIGGYPAWWPNFSSVRHTGERECEFVISSVLPYALTVRLTAVVEDPIERILEATLDGDIMGSVRWAVEPDGPHGCVAQFTEHVVVRKAALRRWMPLARPLFRINHSLAMRAGHRALNGLGA
ncbi:SRPBCC family protein [Streptomyces sp. BR1]|uniref:SRPBCC family protein n=1 Tax=Streptomyces sp. BR1 TaxID=1592323 RepID=UPI00402BEDB8